MHAGSARPLRRCRSAIAAKTSNAHPRRCRAGDLTSGTRHEEVALAQKVRTTMNRLRIAACFLLLPFVANCVATDETETDLDPSLSEELPADEEASTPKQGIFGGDACKSVQIRITNSRTRNGVDTAIEVHKVTYWDASEGDWLTEDLANLMLNHGTTGVWSDEDLEYTENDLITHFRVYYKYLSGGSWSGLVYQEINTVDQTCQANDTFSMTVE
jgi:hypothetical protein